MTKGKEYIPGYLHGWSSQLAETKALTFYNGYRLSVLPLLEEHVYNLTRHVILFDRVNGIFGVATLENQSKDIHQEIWQINEFRPPQPLEAVEFYTALHVQEETPKDLDARVLDYVNSIITERKKLIHVKTLEIQRAMEILQKVTQP